MKIENGVYTHLKTGNLYVVLLTTICADNEKPFGDFRVIYRRLDDDGKIYDRGINEFIEKFRKCNVLPPIQPDYEG